MGKALEMLDRSGRQIGLGDVVEYEGRDGMRVGMVRELTFRVGESGIKVSGAMNRLVGPSEVEVVDVTPREAAVLAAFSAKCAIVDLDEVRRLASEIDAVG